MSSHVGPCRWMLHWDPKARIHPNVPGGSAMCLGAQQCIENRKGHSWLATRVSEINLWWPASCSFQVVFSWEIELLLKYHSWQNHGHLWAFFCSWNVVGEKMREQWTQNFDEFWYYMLRTIPIYISKHGMVFERSPFLQEMPTPRHVKHWLMQSHVSGWSLHVVHICFPGCWFHLLFGWLLWLKKTASRWSCGVVPHQ